MMPSLPHTRGHNHSTNSPASASSSSSSSSLSSSSSSCTSSCRQSTFLLFLSFFAVGKLLSYEPISMADLNASLNVYSHSPASRATSIISPQLTSPLIPLPQDQSATDATEQTPQKADQLTKNLNNNNDFPRPPFQPALLPGRSWRDVYNTQPLAANETVDNRPKKLRTSAMMNKYLTGLQGLEIGSSSHNGFGLNTLNVDVHNIGQETSIYAAAQMELVGVVRRVDVIAPGDNLPFDNATVDFVISSHAIEHFFDPIGAICEWLRVVKGGGYVATIAPHKERTFDAPKNRTQLTTLIQRHYLIPRRDRPKQDEHWSIWITTDFLELCQYMGWKVIEYQDEDDKVGNGFAVVIQKNETCREKC